MGGPIRINPQELQAIARSCSNSSQQMTQEATNLKQQIDRLHEALQGIPSLALADNFQELNGVLGRLSDELAKSDAYLRNVVNKVNDFVASLGH